MGIQGYNSGKDGFVMRMFGLEIKRVLKTKLTIILILIALAISILLPINLAQGMAIYDREGDIIYTGTEAIEITRSLAERFEGGLTPENLVIANKEYVAAMSEYESKYDMPEDIYREKIWPVRDLVNIVGSISIDPNTGTTIPPELRSDEDIANFYQNRTEFMEAYLEAKQSLKDPARFEKAMAINSEIKEPYTYTSAFGWLDSADNLNQIVFVLALLCAAIAAPIFSSEYQTGSDSILRSTKNGRRKLAIVKTGGTLFTSTLLYLACSGIAMGIFCSSFGTEGLASQMQIVFVESIAPLTFGDFMAVIFISGLLTTIAVTCFTLFISTISKTSMVTLIIAFVIVLLPTIISFISGGDIATWIRLCSPAGGVGFGNSIFFEIYALINILKIGSVCVWSPVVILVASVVNIIVFTMLSVVSYNKHEVA